MGTNEIQWADGHRDDHLILPELVLAVAVQKYIIRGLTFGTVK
jgi:hypothetical protein